MAGNWNSGRRPQPTPLKILRGNPGKRRLTRDEPTPPAVDASFDDPPLELAKDAYACAEWARVAPLLRADRPVTEADRSPLMAACLEWSHYLRYRKRRSTLALAHKALSHCERLWDVLGLTPSGRAKITALPRHGRHADKADQKWAGLLSGVTDAGNW